MLKWYNMKESIVTETDRNITGSFGQQKYMQKTRENIPRVLQDLETSS